MGSTGYLEMHADKVSGFEKRFDLVFGDKGLLLAALDHTNPELKKQYAVAGDKLLDYLLFDYLMCRRYSKGKLDCIRQKINTDASLAKIGKDMGLSEFIVFPDSASERERETGDAYYNDTLEALVYVIMKDYGLDMVTQFVTEHIFSKISANEYRCRD